MLSLKPKSIFQLTITGFMLVSGILLITLIITARQLNGLSEQSQQIIGETFSTMQLSRTLTDQASAMERNAMQYMVVGDKEILKVYVDRRNTFQEAVHALALLELGAQMTDIINALISNESAIYETLMKKTTRDVGELQPFNPQLLAITDQVSGQINQWASLQLSDIRQETAETQNILKLQSVFLVSIALFLAGVFTALITRPLLQIEKAITELGSGHYDKRFTISGPTDLVKLGNLLNWLRVRLRKLEQHRSSFFRHVSHELKTPLAAIGESAALLHDDVVGVLSKEQKKIICIQRKHCQRLQVLIDDLLQYQLQSFSVLEDRRSPVRLDNVVEKVIASHELIIRSCKINIVSKLNSVTVKGDAEQLRVIIDNLLTNAIKYSPGGSIVEISLKLHDGRVLFDISDEGPGIALHERDKIFSAFYQGAQHGKEFLKGSGLGLAIAREYILANKGTIELRESVKGAHFQISFQAEYKEI